jgi:hypothetical protein
LELQTALPAGDDIDPGSTSLESVLPDQLNHAHPELDVMIAKITKTINLFVKLMYMFVS